MMRRTIRQQRQSSVPFLRLAVIALVLFVQSWTTTSPTAASASSEAASASSSSSPSHRPFRLLPGRRYEVDDDDDELRNNQSKGSGGGSGSSSSLWGVVGAGREFDLFGSSSSSSSSRDSNNNDDRQEKENDMDLQRQHGFIRNEDPDLKASSPSYSPSVPLDKTVRSVSANASTYSSSHPYLFPSSENDDDPNNNNNSPLDSSVSFPTGASSSSPYVRNLQRRRRQRQQQQKPSLFQPVTDWWSTNISPSIKSWPKIQCRVEPTTTLKLRKTFRPLKTIVRLGADFNTQLGVWQFHSRWEDAIIGGQLTLLSGRELQFSKSWQLSVGAVEDLVTRLRFRAAVDLTTWKAYARVGFRTERLTPINIMEGFTLQKQVPLDGPGGHVRLQVKANFALPEPEIEYSTETQKRSLVGMGDIEVNIEELNLLLDY